MGKLIYLTHTRLDIANGVTAVSQFMHDPRKRHLHAFNIILQYFKTSTRRTIILEEEKMFMETNADLHSLLLISDLQ